MVARLASPSLAAASCLCLATVLCLTAALPSEYGYPLFDKRGYLNYPMYDKRGYPEYPVYDEQWDKPSLEDYLRSLQTPQEVTQFSTEGLGQVSAVDVDARGDVWVMHRADRPWTEETFDPVTNKLTEKYESPIAKDTIFKVNAATGKVISKQGANLLNVPHGMTVDDRDNVWLTDAGRHQVLRIPVGSNVPDLVLGEKFTPGSDDTHFCKPTDVVVASTGEFFVSDGYCNSRIMKFDENGKLLTTWGTANGADGQMSDLSLNLPHSLALVEDLDLICVADRENQRVVCYNAGMNGTAGIYNRTVIPPGELGRIFAIDYSPSRQELTAAVTAEGRTPPRAATYSIDGEALTVWGPQTSPAPSLIHTVAVSKDGEEFFLGDVMQHRVLKYRVKGH